jgi:uncharacterized membrane protein
VAAIRCRCRWPLSLLSWLLALLAKVTLAASPIVDVLVAQHGDVFLVDATVEVEVPLTTAWGVLTDFDHMTSILSNLTASKVTSRNGDRWIVRQTGSAKYGLLSFPFESEREIRLEPMTRILARALSGSTKRMESEARIVATDRDVKISYHAEIEPDSLLLRLFGANALRHEVTEQFMEMANEMTRRNARVRSVAEPPG